MNNVYDYMSVAENICEATIDGLLRSKEKDTIIEFEFRLDRSCYNSKGDDIGPSIRWKVRYYLRSCSRYVKVTWTPYSYRYEIEDWQEIADHDSCWRRCWYKPLAYGRKILEEEFTAKGNESWFFNCEAVREVKE